MCFAGFFNPLTVEQYQRCIIAAITMVNIETIGAVLFLKTF